MAKYIYLLIGLLVLSLIGNGYLFNKVNQKPKTELYKNSVSTKDYIVGGCDTLTHPNHGSAIITPTRVLYKGYSKQDSINFYNDDNIDTIFIEKINIKTSIDTLINVPPSGYIALYSENINTLPLSVNYSLPITEINRVDTVKFTDSIFIPVDVLWYEKPMFTVPITAVSTAILFYLSNK